ncbi:MAG: hypothetical protein IJU62_05015 [Muribaculaceae bacterium]|nr:hypothetical protein [Muribaculaceae bacterium]
MKMIKRIAVMAIAAMVALGAAAHQPTGCCGDKKECAQTEQQCDKAQKAGCDKVGKAGCDKADKAGCDKADKAECGKADKAGCDKADKAECGKVGKKPCCGQQCGDCCKDQCGDCCKDACGKCCTKALAPQCKDEAKCKDAAQCKDGNEQREPAKKEPVKKAPIKKDDNKDASPRIDMSKFDQGKDDARAEARPMVIDYFATWCGPCKALSPILARIEAKYEGLVDFRRVDIDKNSEAVAKDNIDAVPTLIFIYKDGHKERIEGLPGQDEATIEAVLDAAVQSLLE